MTGFGIAHAHALGQGAGGGAGGGAAVWTPATPASLAVWYKPADLSTLYQDDAGTTPITTSGQTAGRISDKSGNARHAVQATASLKPVYSSTGTPCLSFDGTDDAMSLPWAPSGAQTLVMVSKMRTALAAGVYGFPVGTDLNGLSQRSLFGYLNRGGYTPRALACGYAADTPGVGVADALTTSLEALVVTYDGTSPSSTTAYAILINNAAKTVVSTGTIGVLAGAGKIQFASALPIDLYELIGYSAALTGSDLTGLAGYLTTTYGV